MKIETRFIGWTKYIYVYFSYECGHLYCIIEDVST